MAYKIPPLIAGNWKMNGTAKQMAEARKVIVALQKKARPPKCEVMICPPATLLRPLADLRADLRADLGAGRVLTLGGQDCHIAPSGAHTGDISAEMLKYARAKAVIVGHSERRTDHNETDKQIRAKAEAAHRAGLCAIICIGESLRQRRQKDTLRVVRQQLRASLPASRDCTRRNTIIAYEPIWAIGTGLTPSAAQIEEVHRAIRQTLTQRLGQEGHHIRLLYGGSVNADNAAELMAIPHVNGALVGGASLTARAFLKIIDTYC